MSASQPNAQSSFRLKATAWCATGGVAGRSAALVIGGLIGWSVQAQTVRPEAPRPGTPAAAAQAVPGQVPGSVPGSMPGTAQGGVPGAAPQNELLPGPDGRRLVDMPPGQYGARRGAVDPMAVPPTQWLEPSIELSLTSVDNVHMDPSGGRGDIIVEFTPRLGLMSRGPRHRLIGTVGLDHTQYVRDLEPTRTNPVADVSLYSTLIDNAVFFDASAAVDRRAASAYGPQSVGISTENQVNTGVYRASPRFETRSGQGLSARLQSDNTWTRRSGAGVDVAGAYSGNAYSRSTKGHLQREPEPFGFGIEGSEQSLSFDDAQGEALGLKSLRLSAAYRVSPQLTVQLLGGKERNEFNGRVDTDRDVGGRIQWAPLERSAFSLEARRRFFGNGFNAQWSHRSRMFGITVGASREPVTEPESLRLAGNLRNQFGAIYQAQGFSPAQVDALVQSSLNAYGLPDNLVEPVTLYVNRPQLATAGNVTLTVVGRRTAVVLSVYGRQLEQLHRSDDVVRNQLPGDIKQRGAQFSVSFRLTPNVTLDTFARYDHSKSIGGLTANESKDALLSASTSYWLSPHTRVSLGAQHHRLNSSLRAGGVAAANLGTFSVLYKF
ncbi:MAG: hypothetical protein RLZZ618_3072 [Pseudomonadota bacterium]|jgi:uncharacterized protein (PEP-CTERM system associated)